MLEIDKDLLNRNNLKEGNIIVVASRTWEYDYGIVDMRTADVYWYIDKKEKKIIKQKFKSYETNVQPSFFQIFIDEIIDFKISEKMKENNQQIKKKPTPEEIRKKLWWQSSLFDI